MKRSPTLTEQVRRHLKERIVNDEFDGGRIPPETELASDLGVSRTTIRDALGRLESEGAIY
ncbi:MAG: winged helix-turn-helix domain-containing protein, partial [Actinomycetota bacterium]|nr:winged helix-turn-helix domain-containing protein [Actinomycetota bacterium]